MDLSSLPDLTPYVTDIILIFISGSACLYCAALSRRLKKLNNLKTGVGASIVSLTHAIEDTHKAAQEAQQSTLQTVETLRHLLKQSESEAPKIEALLTDLGRAAEASKATQHLLQNCVDAEINPAIKKAQKTASGLLKVVSDVDNYRTIFSIKDQTAKNQTVINQTARQGASENVTALKDAS